MKLGWEPEVRMEVEQEQGADLSKGASPGLGLAVAADFLR